MFTKHLPYLLYIFIFMLKVKKVIYMWSYVIKSKERNLKKIFMLIDN